MTYSPSSKVSEVSAAILAALVAATPDTAPEIAFTEHTDNTCKLESLSDPDGRVRVVEIKSESPLYGQLTWGASVASLERVLRIRVGYPAGRYYPEAPDEVTSAGQRYLVDDLKESDFRQIMFLIEGGGVLSSLTGVMLPLLRGEQDEAGGRVRSILYGVQYVETAA